MSRTPQRLTGRHDPVTARLEGTVIADLGQEAPFWTMVQNRLIPALVACLEKRFQDRYGCSAEQGVSSAVLALVERVQSDGLPFETTEDVRRWLHVVAWRKVKDALAKEHLECRVTTEDILAAAASSVASGCEEAWSTFEQLRASLSQDEQALLDARLAGVTLDKFAAEANRPSVAIQSLWKRIMRKARWMHRAGNVPERLCDGQ